MALGAPIILLSLATLGSRSVSHYEPYKPPTTQYTDYYSPKPPVQLPDINHTKSDYKSFPFASIAVLLFASISVFAYLNPAQMIVGKRGVAYEWTGGLKVWLPWSSIIEIAIKRPTKLSLDSRTWMVFKGAHGELMKVDVVILDECKRKLEIIDLIQNNAEPFVAGEALDILYGSKANSFTELWLETLNTPSARRNTAELKPGDQ